MKRLIPILAIGAVAALASACHSNGGAETRDAGPAVDRTYAIGAFDRIAVSGPYDIKVVSGGQPGVTARGGAAILDATDVVVEDGVLKIRPKERKGNRWRWGRDGQVRMTVNASAVRGATIAGSGGIDLDRASGPDFKGEVAGSGDLAIGTVEANAAAFAIAGSGGVRAGGTVSKLEVSIAGSGDVDLTGGAKCTTSKVGSGNVPCGSTGFSQN
jgi:hypothetical protein